VPLAEENAWHALIDQVRKPIVVVGDVVLACIGIGRSSTWFFEPRKTAQPSSRRSTNRSLCNRALLARQRNVLLRDSAGGSARGPGDDCSDPEAQTWRFGPSRCQERTRAPWPCSKCSGADDGSMEHHRYSRRCVICGAAVPSHGTVVLKVVSTP
jgi:hypothetical protein